jgi:uncharacterized protein
LAATIDVQVLSLYSPGLEQVDGAEAVALAREANQELADAVRNHPARFTGFASLPTAAPDAAVAELERTVRDYSFKGAVINGPKGRYLGDQFFWPILARSNRTSARQGSRGHQQARSFPRKEQAGKSSGR